MKISDLKFGKTTNFDIWVNSEKQKLKSEIKSEKPFIKLLYMHFEQIIFYHFYYLCNTQLYLILKTWVKLAVKKFKIIKQRVFVNKTCCSNILNSFQKFLEELSNFCSSCATYAFPMFIHVLGNLIMQSTNGDFAEYLLVISSNYETQKNSEKYVRIIQFLDLE